MVARVRKKSSVSKEPKEPVDAGEMRVTFERLSELERWPRNPKKHDHEGVSDSMTRWGYTIPIAIDEGTKRIVAGHGRLETLQLRKSRGEDPPERVKVDPETGEWLVPVLRGIAFPNPEEAEAYLLADNRQTELGGYDDAILAEMLREHQEKAKGLIGVGWNEEQVADLVASLAELEEPPDMNPPEAPEEFQEFHEDSKETIHCPKCGFHIPV